MSQFEGDLPMTDPLKVDDHLRAGSPMRDEQMSAYLYGAYLYGAYLYGALRPTVDPQMIDPQMKHRHHSIDLAPGGH